jgi:hypothetical protein
MSVDDACLNPVQVELDEHASLIEDYLHHRRARDRAIAEMAAVRELIEKVLPTEQECPDGVVGTIGGRQALSYLPHARSNVDRQTLTRRYPQIAAEVTKWAVARRFLVSEPAGAGVSA